MYEEADYEYPLLLSQQYITQTTENEEIELLVEVGKNLEVTSVRLVSIARDCPSSSG